MEFRDLLARRRMHRAFLPDPVPEDSVERIVRTIRRAPSGGFSQGQSLVVVTDADLRGRIAEAFDEQGSYVASGGSPDRGARATTSPTARAGPRPNARQTPLTLPVPPPRPRAARPPPRAVLLR